MQKVFAQRGLKNGSVCLWIAGSSRRITVICTIDRLHHAGKIRAGLVGSAVFEWKMCAKQIFLFNRKWVAWYWTRYKCCGCIQIVWDCMSHFSWRNQLNSLQTSACFYRYLSMVEVQEKNRNWEQGVESELLELPITLTWVWFIINAYPTCITPSWAPVAHKLLA